MSEEDCNWLSEEIDSAFLEYLIEQYSNE